MHNIKPLVGQFIWAVDTTNKLFPNLKAAQKHRALQGGEITKYQRIGVAELLKQTLNNDYLLDCICDSVDDYLPDNETSIVDNFELDPLESAPEADLKSAITAARRTLFAALQKTPSSVLVLVLKNDG